MPVDLIDTLPQLKQLRQNWNDVYQNDSETQFFLSWEWLNSIYEQRPETLLILGYRQEGAKDYDAFFPLRKEVRYSKSKALLFNCITMGGNYWADYTSTKSRKY